MNDSATFNGTFTSVAALFVRAIRTHSIQIAKPDEDCGNVLPEGLLIWQTARGSGYGPAFKSFHMAPEVARIGDTVTLIDGQLKVQR